MLSNERVAAACNAPVGNVEVTWALVIQELKNIGLWTKNIAVAAAATIAVETGVSYDLDGDGHKDNCTFLPIKELGGDDRLNRLYDTRTDLGNTPEEDGDGARYGGRGLIQTTGKRNYERVEAATGIPCVEDPDQLLLPENAAKAFAFQFKDLGAAKAAEQGNWNLVRRRVNGGTNGLELFMKFIPKLLGSWEAE